MPFDYDVIVIGAGIHGAAVARECAARGWRVSLIEKAGEAARGTSSKSSKLIHGGLRYLETAQFALVHECLREQAILLKTAPHLVHKSEFVIPVFDGSARPAWKIRLGLYLYWLLGGALPRRLALDELPELNTRGLQAAFAYRDAQTDDAALTRAVLKSAEMMGAEIFFGRRMLRAQCHRDAVSLQVQSADSVQTLNAQLMINAAGPWINEVAARMDGDVPQMDIDLIRGTHIELRGSLAHCCYVEAPDRRAVFVLPWKGHKLVGTTEQLYSGHPDDCVAQANEIDYLLHCHNLCLREPCDSADLINSWAGLRVLPKSSRTAFARARDAVLLQGQGTGARYLAIYGGKLTSHRATALQVVQRLQRVIVADRTALHIDTARQYLPQ